MRDGNGRARRWLRRGTECRTVTWRPQSGTERDEDRRAIRTAETALTCPGQVQTPIQTKTPVPSLSPGQAKSLVRPVPDRSRTVRTVPPLLTCPPVPPPIGGTGRTAGAGPGHPTVPKWQCSPMSGGSGPHDHATPDPPRPSAHRRTPHHRHGRSAAHHRATGTRSASASPAPPQGRAAPPRRHLQRPPTPVGLECGRGPRACALHSLRRPVDSPGPPRRRADAPHLRGTRDPPGVAHHHQNTAEPRTGRTNPVARLRWTAGVRGANGNPDRRNTTKNNTPPQKKKGERGRYRAPLVSSHSRESGYSQPRDGDSPHAWGRRCRFSYNVQELGPSPHAWGADLRPGPDHPHVRGADVHEPNGSALQRTTRYRSYPQFWGYGDQPRLVDVERTAPMPRGYSMPRRY